MIIYKYLLIMFCLLVASLPLRGQDVSAVSGKVQDPSGQPLSGVFVRCLHSGHSAQTDANGYFALTLSTATDTLILSHVGYRRLSLAIRHGQRSLILQMEPVAELLDSVSVSTGYQTFKPNETNGSFTVIGNKMLNQQVGLNILDRLNGVTSSLLVNMGKSNSNPQNTTNISIRGLSTINGPLDPLVVLDNFIYDGDITNLNPNDVESVTVLKDAAAASIWGARAGNGVIVITTKKGKFRQRMLVDYNSTYTVRSKPDLYYLPQISSSDYIEMEQFLFDQGYFNSRISSYPYQALTPAVEVFLGRRKGTVGEADAALQIDRLKSIDTRDQYLRYAYRPEQVQQYALNLRGGSDNLAWLVSGTYDRDAGSLRNTYQKVNLRTENTYRLSGSLTAGLSAYYTNSTNRSGLGGYNTLSVGGRYIPYMQLADGDNTPVAVAYEYRSAYTDTAGAGKLLDWDYVPLEDYRHNMTTTNTEQWVANIGLQYRIIPGLSLDLKYQYQKQHQQTDNLADAESYYVRRMVNLYSQLNRSTGVVTYIVPRGGILTQTYGNNGSYNGRGQLNLNRRWDKHMVSAIAGMEIRQADVRSSGATYYGYQEDPLAYTMIDPVNTYPNFLTGSRAAIGGKAKLSHTVNRFVSAYGNFSYAYDGRYVLSGSLRRDGANVFGANTNDRWKPLWSAGLGWNIDKESFYHLGWLPHLKLSATAGASGNVDMSKTALPVITMGGTADYTRLPYARSTVLNNPDLRWEQVRQVNYRLEFALRDAILSGSVEYYTKKGTDLYGDAVIDYTAWGFSQTTVQNVANMKGKGWDIQLNGRNHVGKLAWNTNLLLSYSRSLTDKYNNAALNGINQGTSIYAMQGYPLYSIAAYKWGGLDAAGNPQGYIDGELSTNYSAMGSDKSSFHYVGPATPSFFGSVWNEWGWKGWSLSMNIMYKFGYYLFKPTLSYYNLASGYTDMAPGYSGRWQQPGDETQTNVPSMVYPLNSARDAFYAGADINVIKADHVRLQFVNISYDWSLRGGKKLFSSLQLYGNVSNIGILWRANKDRLDPDYLNTYPLPKTYAVGIRTNF